MLKDSLALSGHEVVIGRTQSGKTHYAIHARAAAWQGAVMFFNPQGFHPGKGWVHCTGDDNLRLLMRAVGLQRMRLCYIPSDRDDIAAQELDVLVTELMRMQHKEQVLLIADEAQDFADPLKRIARRGLARGVTGCFISQRPAEMHNTLLTQAVRHVIFASAWESQYFKRYGLDADRIQSLLAAAPKHSYVIYANGTISGAYCV